MATKTRQRNRTQSRAPRAGGRTGRGRSTGSSGPMGILNRITSTVGRTGGRGATRGGGLTSQASSFVRGLLGSGGKSRSGRRRF